MSTKTKNFLTVGAFILAVITCLMAVINVFGIDFKKDLNTDNLLKYEDYDKNLLRDETSAGMNIKWYKDGSFALYGKHADKNLADTQYVEYQFWAGELPVGQYTLSANNDDAGDDFGLYVDTNSLDNVTLHTNKGEVTFTVTDGTAMVAIGWYVKNNKRIIFEKIEPTLVSGTDAIEFYK